MAQISTNNIAQAIYESSKGKEGQDLHTIIESTTRVLASKHLLNRAPEILTSLQDIFDKKDGIIRARVESSHELSKSSLDEIEDQLKKRYKAKEIYLESVIDESHLGGIKIQVADEVIDFTLAHHLSQLQNYLIAH